MTTSGVSKLSRSASDIVQSALRRARIIPVRQPVSPIDLSNGIYALNNMIAELRAQGWHLWKSQEYIVFLEKGKTDYFIGPTGDRTTLLDEFIQDKLAIQTTVGDTQLTISDTSRFTGSNDLLSFSPTTSTADWTVLNASISSDGTTLNILNSAIGGYAQYAPIDTLAGTDYFFEIDIAANVGVVTLEVYSGLSMTLLGSTVVAVNGTQTVFFTATEESSILRIVNDNVAGDTDAVNFRLRETDTGEEVGFRVGAGLREWNTVTRILSATEIAVKNTVANVGAVNQSVVAFKNKPARPLKNRNYRSKNINFIDEIPINIWSRAEYMKQTTKTSEGLPTQAYYQPTLDNGRLYIWQVADDVDQAVLFTSDTPLEIMVENADSPDFPAEWFNMLSWGLASELGPEYGVPSNRQSKLEEKALSAKETASDWDEEQGSLLIGPDNDA